jgi:hypothetical protein
MNTSSLVAEFVSIQKQKPANKLDTTQRDRWLTLKQALELAEVRVPIDQRIQSQPGGRLRLRDGDRIREVHLPELSQPEVEVKLDAETNLGALSVVVVEPGPGLPAYAAYARVLGPAQRGQGWYRLALE